MEVILPHYISKESKSGTIFGLENEKLRLMKAKLMKAVFVIVRLLLAGGANYHW